jgi:hypothetical protein
VVGGSEWRVGVKGDCQCASGSTLLGVPLHQTQHIFSAGRARPATTDSQWRMLQQGNDKLDTYTPIYHGQR